MDNIIGCGCERCRHKLCAGKVPVFSTLEERELNKVMDLIVRKRYDKGEMIVMEGSRPEALIIVSKGQAKAFRYTHDGKEQILYIFSEGDFFGEKNLLRDQAATYNVEALEETHICTIDKKNFQELLRKHPDIGLKIIEELCSRLERLENAVQSMGTKSIETRINSVLLEFSRKYGKSHPEGLLVELPLSREGIANYIGVARETVSRKLGNLQDEGVIRMLGNKKIIILDKKALQESVE